MTPIDTTQTVTRPQSPHPRRQFLTQVTQDEALLVLDNTALSKIKACHKAAQNYLVLGRQGHARSAALVFGGAIHKGLELFNHAEYLAQQELAPDPAFSPSAQDQTVSNYFLDNPLPASVASSDYRTLPAALEVLRHYRHRCNPTIHPDYEAEILSDPSGPLIERAFEIPLCVLEGSWQIGPVHFSKIHVAWSGRIDLVVRSNGSRILDHKTSSIKTDTFTQSFQLASQTLGYVWAGRQLWPELSILGFCLNCLNLTRPAKSQPNLGMLERGPRGGEPRLQFFRAYFDYTSERLARWERDTIATIEDFLHSVSRNHFPLNDKSCFDYGMPCQYHDCCILDNEAAGEALLFSDQYEPVTWNPTN